MDERTQDFSADYATGADVGADLYTIQGTGSEANELEARAREIRAEEAREAEARQERARVEQAREAHCAAMRTASDSLGRAVRNVLHLSMVRTRPVPLSAAIAMNFSLQKNNTATVKPKEPIPKMHLQF